MCTEMMTSTEACRPVYIMQLLNQLTNKMIVQKDINMLHTDRAKSLPCCYQRCLHAFASSSHREHENSLDHKTILTTRLHPSQEYRQQ